jgi:cytoskeletal protein RodZ
MGLGGRGDPGLKAIRESRGVSLDAIAEATRINPFYLRAIETGDLDKLPGEFYARSYARQYARAAGFDERELLKILHLQPAVSESTTSPPNLAPCFWQRAEE